MEEKNKQVVDGKLKFHNYFIHNIILKMTDNFNGRMKNISQYNNIDKNL